MKTLGLKELYLDFRSYNPDDFAVQGEGNARGLKFRIVDSKGVIDNNEYDVSWNMTIAGKSLSEPVKAVREAEWYIIRYPKLATQVSGLAKAQITIVKDDKVLKTKPYRLRIYEDVAFGSDDVVELENQGERLKELIAETEKALDDIQNGLEGIDTIKEESEELIQINKQLIEESKELISSGNIILQEANELSLELEGKLIKATELEERLETGIESIDQEFITLEIRVDELVSKGETMISQAESTIVQAKEVIEEVRNAIEQGIDDEIQEIIENKITELSVSYNQLENKPRINGVELVGELLTEDLGIRLPTNLSELKNDVGYVNEDKVVELIGDNKNISKLSELENDTGFITKGDVPDKLSAFENDTGFITIDNIPKQLSEDELEWLRSGKDDSFTWTNTDGYSYKIGKRGFEAKGKEDELTINMNNDNFTVMFGDTSGLTLTSTNRFVGLLAKGNLALFDGDDFLINQRPILGSIDYNRNKINEVESKIPAKVSQLENDKYYADDSRVMQLIEAYKPKKVSELTNDAGYITANYDKIGKVMDTRDKSTKMFWTGTKSQLPSSRLSTTIYLVTD